MSILFAEFDLTQYVFGPLLFLLSTFIVLIILLQRGRGGGLAGALGGAGGSSAFGTKAGDVFTRITAFLVIGWIVTCAFVCWFYLPAKLDIEADAPVITIGGDAMTPGTLTAPKEGENAANSNPVVPQTPGSDSVSPTETNGSSATPPAPTGLPPAETSPTPPSTTSEATSPAESTTSPSPTNDLPKGDLPTEQPTPAPPSGTEPPPAEPAPAGDAPKSL